VLVAAGLRVGSGEGQGRADPDGALRAGGEAGGEDGEHGDESAERFHLEFLQT
jgi:hypothetical protein